MTTHLAKAHMRLHQPAFTAAYDSIARELYNTRFKTFPKPLQSFVRVFEGAFGVRIVSKGGLDLFEYVQKRGLILGGSEMGNYLENEIMEHVFKNTAIFSSPESVFVALWTATTGEANDSGTEVSGTGYDREEVAAANWAAVSDGATSNSSDVDFGTAGSGGWGSITDATLEDAASSSNRYFYSPLAAPKTVSEGDTFKFAAGDIDVSVS